MEGSKNPRIALGYAHDDRPVRIALMLAILVESHARTTKTTTPIYRPFSTTIWDWVIRYQKGRTILDFNETKDDDVEVASAGPYANQHTSQLTMRLMPAPHHSIFTDRMLFLPPNQQCQSAEGTCSLHLSLIYSAATELN